ncbi:MAG: hypothetical protein P9X22_08630 [Candidatus Zapsychrus exili]|nr:hypothetical protein [Candidatus Zapsychrus exili]
MRKLFFKIFCIVVFSLIALVVSSNFASANSSNFRVEVINSIRSSINEKREACGIEENYSWSDEELIPGETPVKADHIYELRDAVKEIYALAPNNGTYDFNYPEVSILRESHIDEVWSALNDAPCCGDGNCDSAETVMNCVQDCGAPTEIPQNLTALAGDGWWIDLTWEQSYPIVNSARQLLSRSIQLNPFKNPVDTPIEFTGGLVQGAIDTDIDLGTTYYYRVKVQYEFEPGVWESLGDWSDTVSATACEEGYLWDGNSCEVMECNIDDDCDDSNDCTNDECVKPQGQEMKVCVNDNLAAGTSCDYGTGTCDGAGTCQHLGEDGYCGDGDHDPATEECDDGEGNVTYCSPETPTPYCSDSCVLVYGGCEGSGNSGNGGNSSELCGNGICDPEENVELCPEDCVGPQVACNKDGECNDENECTVGECINPGTEESYCVLNPTPGERCRTYNPRGQTIWGECTYDGSCVNISK